MLCVSLHALRKTLFCYHILVQPWRSFSHGGHSAWIALPYSSMWSAVFLHPSTSSCSFFLFGFTHLAMAYPVREVDSFNCEPVHLLLCSSLHFFFAVCVVARGNGEGGGSLIKTLWWLQNMFVWIHGACLWIVATEISNNKQHWFGQIV